MHFLNSELRTTFNASLSGVDVSQWWWVEKERDEDSTLENSWMCRLET